MGPLPSWNAGNRQLFFLKGGMVQPHIAASRDDKKEEVLPLNILAGILKCLNQSFRLRISELPPRIGHTNRRGKALQRTAFPTGS